MAPHLAAGYREALQPVCSARRGVGSAVGVGHCRDAHDLAPHLDVAVRGKLGNVRQRRVRDPGGVKGGVVVEEPGARVRVRRGPRSGEGRRARLYSHNGAGGARRPQVVRRPSRDGDLVGEQRRGRHIESRIRTARDDALCRRVKGKGCSKQGRNRLDTQRHPIVREGRRGLGAARRNAPHDIADVKLVEDLPHVADLQGAVAVAALGLAVGHGVKDAVLRRSNRVLGV
mmetsp:Transcript_31762/g.80798  ORF Transcript_31762/g.80798 Transcript_31762/m.80798 type:complete len:229 (-) Transcript_31762:3454-4140(-)